MSGKVKLIIEIPKEMMKALEVGNLDSKYNPYDVCWLVRNGIPLDDVKAEIKTFTITEKSEYDIGFNDAVLKCFNILDNIGKESEE